jgi:hypothetical protein
MAEVLVWAAVLLTSRYPPRATAVKAIGPSQRRGQEAREGVIPASLGWPGYPHHARPKASRAKRPESSEGRTALRSVGSMRGSEGVSAGKEGQGKKDGSRLHVGRPKW